MVEGWHDNPIDDQNTVYGLTVVQRSGGTEVFVTQRERGLSRQLEIAVAPQGRLRYKRILVICEFNTQSGQYTGRTFKYAKDSSDYITGAVNNATNIFVTGDMTHISGDRYMIIERDDFQGPPTGTNPPRQKKLYLFDLNEVSPSTNILSKWLVVDLLDIDDPDDIGGPLVGIDADKFNFPLQSVESLTPIDDVTLLVGLDNNYPGGNGRVPGTPDGTEIITLRSKVPLRTLCVEPCKDASTGARNGHDPKSGGCR